MKANNCFFFHIRTNERYAMNFLLVNFSPDTSVEKAWKTTIPSFSFILCCTSTISLSTAPHSNTHNSQNAHFINFLWINKKLTKHIFSSLFSPSLLSPSRFVSFVRPILFSCPVNNFILFSVAFFTCGIEMCCEYAFPVPCDYHFSYFVQGFPACVRRYLTYAVTYRYDYDATGLHWSPIFCGNLLGNFANIYVRMFSLSK